MAFALPLPRVMVELNCHKFDPLSTINVLPRKKDFELEENGAGPDNACPRGGNGAICYLIALNPYSAVCIPPDRLADHIGRNIWFPSD